MSKHLCPYCVMPIYDDVPDGDVHTCGHCGQLFVWSPTTFYEIQGREAIRDLRRLREEEGSKP